MEHVKAFGNELHSLHELKPPISRAKMSQITKTAMRAIKFYKHIVQAVEKFIHKCRPEYKVPGLYVIDSIVRQSRHQYGSDKDVFVPRFIKNFCSTFQQLFKCPDEDKSKIVRVLNLWQKNGVLPIDIIQPLLDLAKDPMNPAVFENAQRDIETAAAKFGSAKKSSTDVTGDTDGEAPPAEPGSKHTDLIESITELLMQQNQQPVSPAAAVAAQQLQQQLHNLQRQLLQETAAGGSADAAAAALSNLENLAEQLLQQHQASLSATAGGAKVASAAGDGGLAPPPPPPAPGSARSLAAENGGYGTKQAPVAAFNSKLLDYDYDDSDEDLDRRSDSHEHHLDDSNGHELAKVPASSSAAVAATTTADTHGFKPQDLLMTHSLAAQHLLLPAFKPPQLFHEHMAPPPPAMPPQPLFGFPDFQHHPALLAAAYNGQVISSLLPPVSLALSASPLSMQQHMAAGGTLTADGRLVVGGTILHSSELSNQPPMPHGPPPATHVAPPVPHTAPPLPHAPPPVPHAPPPMPTSQPPLPPPTLNDDGVAEEDVDYRTDMDYRVLRDRDERDRIRDDRERSGRDGRRRSRSPRRYRSPERDSRHRRSRSRERRNRSRSKEREREELERKRREKERERRHQGLPPFRDKCAIVCSTTLWIGRLNKQTTENDIRRELEQHGPVLTINLIPPRGCAYVCMTTRSDATKALDRLLKGVRLHNNTLKAAWAPPKAIGENLELKSFWDVERGCAYVPFDRLPSDLSALNGEGVFVDEDSLPDHLKQQPQSSSPSPVKEEVQPEKAVLDASGTSTTSTVITEPSSHSPSRVAQPAQHMSQPFMTAGMIPAHVMASMSHHMPHSSSFLMSGIASSMVPLMAPTGRGPQLLVPHGIRPAGVPPPSLGLQPSLPGLIPGGIGVPLPAVGGLFSASPLQRHPVAMPLGLMSLPPLPGGVPPPLPPSSLPPHPVPPPPSSLHSQVSQIAASGQASANTVPGGSKEAGHHEENPQLARAIENIVSNAASIQAVVQAAAAVSAIASTAPGSTGSAASTSSPAALLSLQSVSGSLQSEVVPTGNQVSVPSQSVARSGAASDDKASWNKTLDNKDPDIGDPDDSVMEESVDEDDEDDGGANSMGGPGAIHQHHRQPYQYRGQGHRPYLPRPPAAAGPAPGQHFQPDGRRMPPWGQRAFPPPPPGFQGPPPPTHMRPPPQFGFRPLLHEPPFNPRMMPPGMAPLPPLGHHGPPPPLGLPPHGPPPHGPPPLGILPHGLPPHGLPPHGPPPMLPPHFDGPPFDMPPFDGSRPFLGAREDSGSMPSGSKPARRSRWQGGAQDEDAAAPPGSGGVPVSSHGGEDSNAAPPPTIQ